MSFNQFAGTVVVPTLSRIVLALAFVTAGVNKFKLTEFSTDDAATLEQIGVTMKLARAGDTGGPRIVAAADVRRGQETPGGGAGTPPEPEPAAGAPGMGPGAKTGEQTAPPAGTAGGGRYARALHHITLMCLEQGWPQPQYLALAAALTELLGGILILIGFLSRIWGLGLAVMMGVAFYLVSMGTYHVLQMSPFALALDIPKFNAVFTQLGLLVLALGVFLTGPGPLSLDRLLFGRSGGGKKRPEPRAARPPAPGEGSGGGSGSGSASSTAAAPEATGNRPL